MRGMLRFEGTGNSSWIIALGGIVIAGMLVGVAHSGDSKEVRMDYRGTLLVQLRVASLENAISFYTDVLDFELLTSNDALKWAELSFGVPGVKVGLGESADANSCESVSLNIGVRNVDAARALLERRGVKFLRDTQEVPGKVRLADFVDPDGNKIRLAQSLGA